MPLPVALQLSQGVALQVVDYQVQPLTGKLDATGSLVLSYDTIDPTQLWRVERVVVQHASAKQLTCTVYGGNDPRTPQARDVRDWTPIPSGFIAVAEYPQPMTVLGGSFLSVQLTGGNQNDTVVVSAQWALVQRVVAGT